MAFSIVLLDHIFCNYNKTTLYNRFKAEIKTKQWEDRGRNSLVKFPMKWQVVQIQLKILKY